MGKLESLQTKLGHSFRDRELLTRALTHASRQEAVYSNERLEFLGDAVLALVVSQHLFQTYPHLTEGDLSQVRAQVVNQSSLNDIARSLGIDEYLLLAAGISNGPGIPDSIMANALEALVGALYLDGGLEAGRRFILAHTRERMADLVSQGGDPSWKSRLQQHTQATGQGLPSYNVVATEGPEHRKEYTVEVSIRGRSRGRGTAGTKKQAEELAAREALQNLDEGADSHSPVSR